MSVTRARDEQAKASRRHQLLAAAATRLDAAGYAATTMSEIAAEAGLAKGTTYLYFRSKEALFLELLLEELAEWSVGVAGDLGAARTRSLGDLPAWLAAGLVRRPRLLRLLALGYPVLEAGADAAAVHSFHRRRRELLAALASRLEAAAPALAGRGLRLVLDLHALAVGCAELASAARLDRDRDFERELASGLGALLGGRRAAGAPAP